MRKIGKAYSSILLVVSIVFLCNECLYAYDSEDLLRVPVNLDYRRIKDTQEQLASNGATEPFTLLKESTNDNKRAILKSVRSRLEDNPSLATPQNLRLVLEMLIDPDWDVCSDALKALPYFDKASFTPPNLRLVLEMLKYPHWGVPSIPLKALPYFDKASFTQPNRTLVLGMLKYRDSDVSSNALKALQYFNMNMEDLQSEASREPEEQALASGHAIEPNEIFNSLREALDGKMLKVMIGSRELNIRIRFSWPEPEKVEGKVVLSLVDLLGENKIAIIDLECPTESTLVIKPLDLNPNIKALTEEEEEDIALVEKAIEQEAVTAILQNVPQDTRVMWLRPRSLVSTRATDHREILSDSWIGQVGSRWLSEAGSDSGNIGSEGTYGHYFVITGIKLPEYTQPLNEHIVETANEDIKNLFDELTRVFEETLTPLKEGKRDITVETLRELFSSKKDKIWEIFLKIKEEQRTKFFYGGELGKRAELEVILNPSFGLCVETIDSLERAIANLGLTKSLNPHRESVEMDGEEIHFYTSVSDKDGIRIAIDATYGRYVGRKFKRIMISPLDKYRDQVGQQARRYGTGRRHKWRLSRIEELTINFRKQYDLRKKTQGILAIAGQNRSDI